MPALTGAEIEGLVGLRRAFRRYSKELDLDLRRQSKEVGEIVSVEATHLAAASIRNIGDRWPINRVGVTRREIYVVPKEKGRRARRNPALRRPNLAQLLISRSYDPALRAKRAEAIAKYEQVLVRVAKSWGIGG